MGQTDAVVMKETKYIGMWVLIFSALLQSVFLVIGKWHYSVLLGNLLSGFFAVLNFFLMGKTVQKALGKDEKEARTMVKVSQTYRNLMILVVTAVGVLVPVFNTVAVIVPVFFPRIAIAIRPFFNKERK